MHLNKIFIYITSTICLIVSIFLFVIKDLVTSMTGELSYIKKQIQTELHNIHMLNAELTYLTSPKRLKTLSEAYLPLYSTKISQIKCDILNPSTNILAENNNIGINTLKVTNSDPYIKWRYKKINNQYITMLSNNK